VRFTERGWRCYEADGGSESPRRRTVAAQIGEERYRAMSPAASSVGFDVVDESLSWPTIAAVSSHTFSRADQPVAELEHVQDAKN